ncbi:unnamed protein product [Zymoseptoria tritici ST99CH_1E4]|uniref:Uncharacterized protein n=1 Tax=Zymoseptoria tritici ST99CH_1E4 TaxID=1276532 RepID=A0A2H1FYH4_ZYMTR|nr:unnamed protein product [Zymoseptoria tritici ST99CH_1E4]
MAILRRSKRDINALKLSNGRDYLSCKLRLARTQLEQWLTSDTVLPHLVLWSKLCIDNPRRYNDASEWVNFVGGKYFADGGELEEDLLLACLGEGQTNTTNEEGGGNSSVFADHDAKTASWCTQDMWARAAWRIVQDNCGPGGILQRDIEQHPAAAYAVAIDILCLAFHSIAWRETASCWWILINSTPSQEKSKIALTNHITSTITQQALKLDHKADTESSVDSEMEQEELSDDDTVTMVTASESAESEFTDPESPWTKATSVSETSQVTPTRSHKKKVADTTSGFDAVQDWMDRVPSIGDGVGVDGALKLIDEEGEPIKGYRRMALRSAGAAPKPVVTADSLMVDSDEIVVASWRMNDKDDDNGDEIDVAGMRMDGAEDDDDVIVVAGMRSDSVFDKTQALAIAATEEDPVRKSARLTDED